MKKFIFVIAALLMLNVGSLCADDVFIEKHRGLQRNPQADKIQDFAHARFDNVYLKDDKIRVIKGRDKLNTTALVDQTINMACYYESSDNTTKKLLIRDSDELISYDVDFTNPVVLIGSLADERASCKQIGSFFYMQSLTDGLIKWIGSGSATAVGTAVAPASVTFTSTSGDGALTTGFPIQVTPNVVSDASCNTACSDGLSFNDGSCNHLSGFDLGGENVTVDSGTREQPETTVTYKYAVTGYNTKTGLESEPSATTTVVLSGDDTFTWSATNCTICDPSGTDTTCDNVCCTGVEFVTTGAETRTTATLVAATAPYNSSRVYRSFSGGDDLFLLGDQNGGVYNDGASDGALSVPLDTKIETIDPPASRYIEEYKGSIFITDGPDLRFNQVSPTISTDADTYWLDTDHIATGSIKDLRGLSATANSLILCSEDTMFELTGFGVDSFRLSRIATGIGCISNWTMVVDSDGNLIFFAGKQGVYKLAVGKQQQDDLSGAVLSQPNAVFTRLSSPVLDDVFNGRDSDIPLDTSTYADSHAYYDRENDLYWLFIDKEAFIFDNRNASWSHIPATQMVASVYARSSSGDDIAFIMDNDGFVYKNFVGYEMGVESGTVLGQVTASTSSTLTDSNAAFNITDDGLAGTWIFIDNEDGEFHQIESNTETVITIADTWIVNPSISYEYYIAHIIVDTLSKQYSASRAPNEMKTLYISTIYNTSPVSQTMDMLFLTDKETDTHSADLTFNLNSGLIRHKNLNIESPWIQWQQKAFVYNTSDTIDPPLDIVSYRINYRPIEERG